VPGVTLDAVKLTNLGKAHIQNIEGENAMRRTSRAFFEGLGGVLDHYGAKIGKLRDDLVVSKMNGKPVTYADIKKFSSMRDPNARTDVREKANEFDRYSDEDLKDMHESAVNEREQMEGRGNLPEAKEKYIERIEAELERRKEASSEEREGREEPTADTEKHAGVSDDNIHRAEAEGRVKPIPRRPDVVSRAEEQVARERAQLLDATKNEIVGLDKIPVHAKLYDKEGRELIWNGSADKHPGKMSALDAAKSIFERRDILKKLMSCVGG
jgi:hypothetical protein